MPRRTRLRDRVTPPPPPPGGREAIYGESDLDERTIVEAMGTNGAGAPHHAARWEAGHKRVTFYCSKALLAALEAEMGRSNRTKTQVIVDALTDHITPHARSVRRPDPGGSRR
ncbi:MAG: hypothetical protein ABR564_04200 [Candidatus Dormibacteria bacterium]